MKNKADELDADKLKPSPTDLSKLSDVAQNEVLRKDEYDDLV